MGHVIDYISTDKKENIMMVAIEFAEENVNRREDPYGDYHGNMRIIDAKIYNTIEEAEKAIEDMNLGSYHDVAVPYYSALNHVPTKKVQNLIERIQKNQDSSKEYQLKNTVKNHKAKLITCKKCESKVAKDYLVSEFCPVCKSDLRSDYIQERIKKFTDDDCKLKNELSIEKEKSSKKNKGIVHWLVKVEVHV